MVYFKRKNIKARAGGGLIFISSLYHKKKIVLLLKNIVKKIYGSELDYFYKKTQQQ